MDQETKNQNLKFSEIYRLPSYLYISVVGFSLLYLYLYIFLNASRLIILTTGILLALIPITIKFIIDDVSITSKFKPKLTVLIVNHFGVLLTFIGFGLLNVNFYLTTIGIAGVLMVFIPNTSRYIISRNLNLGENLDETMIIFSSYIGLILIVLGFIETTNLFHRILYIATSGILFSGLMYILLFRGILYLNMKLSKIKRKENY